MSGFSQREIATNIGYSRSYINNVCNGISPLTLRVIQGVRNRLGDELYRLAIVRARQLKVEEDKRHEEHQQFIAMQRKLQREQVLRYEEQRRQDAIATLKEQIEAEEPEGHEQQDFIGSE